MDTEMDAERCLQWGSPSTRSRESYGFESRKSLLVSQLNLSRSGGGNGAQLTV